MGRPKKVEATTTFPDSGSSTIILCSPCQVKERGSTTICGWQGRSLSPHLKAHRMSGGRVWDTKLYAKKFPKFSMGAPTYSPSKVDIARLQAAAPANIQKLPPPTNEEKLAKDTEKQTKIDARMDELWSMCERDPAARMICMTAARDEVMIAEFYDELDQLRDSRNPDNEKLQFINKSLAAANTRYGDSMSSLALTVKQRRASNLLGSDSVSQLICGYANTLRKMSPERQEAFHRREATVMANIVERIRVKLLDVVDVTFDKTADVADEHDFRTAILSFNPEKS